MTQLLYNSAVLFGDTYKISLCKSAFNQGAKQRLHNLYYIINKQAFII